MQCIHSTTAPDTLQFSTVLVKLRPHTENLFPVRFHTKEKPVLEPITMRKTLLKITIKEN